MRQSPIILTIEDDQDIRILVVKILQSKGFQVLEAETGREGIKLCKEKHPDLILLDLSLSDIKGLEVAKTIKSAEETKEIPIVVLTAKAMKGTKEEALQAQCSDFLIKPFLPQHLLSVIGRYIKWN